MRRGTLNRHLPISPQLRVDTESKMLPQLARSALLDNALKRLGFHRRAEGQWAKPKLEHLSQAASRSVKKLGTQDTDEARPLTPTASLEAALRPNSVIRRGNSPADIDEQTR